MRTFDLIEFQRDARDKNKPEELFRLWEEVCHAYDRGIIGQYELDEMKAVIWPNLQAVSLLKNAIDSSFTSRAA